MAGARKSSSDPTYVFPGRDPDDKTLGGAIPAELFDELQASAGTGDKSGAGRSGETS